MSVCTGAALTKGLIGWLAEQAKILFRLGCCERKTLFWLKGTVHVAGFMWLKDTVREKHCSGWVVPAGWHQCLGRKVWWLL